MKLEIRFCDKHTMTRFCNFLSVVDDHKSDAKGVIITFSRKGIQIVYSILEEKKESQNYIDYDRENYNYFLFTYMLDLDCTFSKIIFENLPYKLHDEEAHILRMEINDFSCMYKAISENISKYDSFLIRAKTKKDCEPKINVLRLKFSTSKNFVITEIPIKNSRSNYQTISPMFPNAELLTVETNFRGLKEVVERFKKIALSNGRDLDNYFIITISREKKQNTTVLWIYFLLNKISQISLEIEQEHFHASEKFNDGISYAVRLDKFFNLINDYDYNNYNTLNEMIFYENEIIFRCFTSGFDVKDKKNKTINYSDYIMSLYAPIIPDEESFEDILEHMAA